MNPSSPAPGSARRFLRIRSLRTLFLLLALLASLPWQPSLAAAAAAPSPQSALAYSVAAQTQPEQVSPGAQYLAAVPGDPAASRGGQRYFTQTGHFLRGRFLEYWEINGGTAVLGLPITEPVAEDGLTVQYLERARLEFHPEIAPTNPNRQVLLTRLGVIMSQARGLQFQQLPSGSSTFTSVFFRETGHNLANAFLEYWQRNGGLAVFGYPISEEFVEISPTDGREYTVQYFERNRFEWHPERKPPYNVQLGLLGVEYARYNALDPLARVMLPAPLAATEDQSDDPRLTDQVDPDLLPAVKVLGRTPQFRWVPTLLLENHVLVEIQDFDEDGVAGAFVATRTASRRYVIIIPERYRGARVEALASVLAHEATHAYNYISTLTGGRQGCSIEEELRSYMNGLSAWVVLGGATALTDRYEPDTLEEAVNSSLTRFYNGRTELEFDLDLDQSRSFLRRLYGPDCGD
jgi:hypothetical protein